MSKLDELRGKWFPVLDKGHVMLVDAMGDDHAICQAARISYGEGTRSVSDDRTLIRYLMRMGHTSPFEMAELKFHVQVPMDTWRQWARHRTASVNEYSTRYSEAIDEMQATPPDGWRLQSAANKQGSGDMLTEWTGEDGQPNPSNDSIEYALDHAARIAGKIPMDTTLTPGQALSIMEDVFHREARYIYGQRLKMGVAREQARKDLPLSTYTRAVWKIDLHNLLHFLSLRMDSHAQQEIREYATVIGREIVAPLFPLAWEAFQCYRLDAVTLSALDIQAIRMATGCDPRSPLTQDIALSHIENKRERDECRAKLVRLGLIAP